MNIAQLITNKRIVLALGMIVVVAAIVISGTGAFFSDSETSANNVFTAGSIDLKVDHLKQTYNGFDCETCSVSLYSSASTMVVDSSEGAAVDVDSPQPAVEVENPHTAWEDESTLAPAEWIWVEGSTNPADTTADTEYTFEETFFWQGDVADVSLDLGLAADNGYMIILNGETIVDKLDEEFNYATAVDLDAGQETAFINAMVLNGENTLEIIVRNLGLANGTPESNPAGLLFGLEITRANCEGDNDFQAMCSLWNEKDLEEGDSFFNFSDVKPGDWGTNVISLHVYTNDAYACVYPHDITESENGMTEPEDEVDTTSDDGELGDLLEFFVWEDDGDGVHEGGEEVIVEVGGDLGDMRDGERLDLQATTTAYVTIAWCAGDMTLEEGEVSCDGSEAGNITQTDQLEAFLTAYAVQQRNNGDFSCDDVDMGDYDGDNDEEPVEDWVETANDGGDATEADGILILTTADDVNSRVRYTNESPDMDLDMVTGFQYDSRQVSASDTVNGNASFRLIVDLNGDASLIKDITFEPYYNIAAHNAFGPASIVPNIWQTWKATQTEGKFWASGVTTSAGLSVGGGAYATNFTLAELSAAYPNAKVTGISIGMGTYNTNQVVEVDNLDFNSGDVTGF
jgi:predicted ribosomally synthesized peptide with SipW-like signal peptide